jgi:hypothetical protein
MSTVTPPRNGIPIGFADTQTGEVRVHPEYLRFFESVFTRVGGTVGSGTNDLTLSQFEDAGIEEVKASAAHLADELGQVPSNTPTQWSDVDSELSALRAEIDSLRVAVDALIQGTMA